MGVKLFWRQFSVLVWKNFVVLSKNPWFNLVRCLLLPIGYAVFLSVAQFFLHKPNNFGLGTSVPVPLLANEYDGSLPLVWVDSTNGAGSPSAEAIMSQVMLPFNAKQRANVKRVQTADEVPSTCPENFIGLSECYAVLVFNALPSPANPRQSFNYTLRADSGLNFIDVVKHTSSFEERVMPVQWAVDSAIIELVTSATPNTPYEWPFTQLDNTEQLTAIRLSYLRGTRMILVLAHFIAFVGVAYQLPGAFSGERANLLTSHMKAMGLMDSARITSWHFSMSLINLPGWIGVALIWHYRIFTATNVGILLLVHVLLGLSLASWSFFIATPFGNSPQLAAIVSSVVACILAILTLVIGDVNNYVAVIVTLVLPPGFYVFAIRAICGFELQQVGASLIRPDPDGHIILLPLIFAAIANVFIWPTLAVLFERLLYDARNPSSCWGRKVVSHEEGAPLIPPDVAISIRHLGKDFKTSGFMGSKGVVTAIEDLSLDIPKTGIFVLLGSNGAGKSTTMSILAGLLGRTRGMIQFEGGMERPPLGTIGLVPQKNVLFPELTCYQTLRIWKAIKPPRQGVPEDEDLEQLLRDCDLGNKAHYNASALSGGQKRKLQLAIGLVGGSQILLVDECTSGVDPLSRRALWKILSSVRHERTVIFTTHFLDEADLLADTIAVLAAPGKLVGQGTPVALKTRYGEGYVVQVSFDTDQPLEKPSSDSSQVLELIRPFAPCTYAVSSSLTDVTYYLKTKDPNAVHKVLEVIQQERDSGRLHSYSVSNTSMEDVFLTLMRGDQEGPSESLHKSFDSLVLSRSSTPDDTLKSNGRLSMKTHIRECSTYSLPMLPYDTAPTMELTNGRRKSVLGQAATVFYKRYLIIHRSWLAPLIMILVTAAGASIPLFFLSGLAAPTCVQPFKTASNTSLYLPSSQPLMAVLKNSSTPGNQILQSPPGLVETLGSAFAQIPVRNFQDNGSFVTYVDLEYRNESIGGISMDYDSSSTLIAWEATPPGVAGLTMLNLASNLLYNHALNETNRVAPSAITAEFENLVGYNDGILSMLKFMAFFGATLSVFPAFFGLYVSKERRSAVQAMQFSNGLSNPAGLWLGHLMFDSIFAVFIATLIIVIYAFASNQFTALAFFWLVLVMYGIVGALFSYCISLAVPSPLATFALSAGYQAVMFLLYLAGFLLTATYADITSESHDFTLIHFILAIASPIANAVHASFVSLNLFSLLCDNAPATAASEAMPSRFGGPIIYLFVYTFVLFGILVWVDSGAVLPRRKATAAASAIKRRFSRKSTQLGNKQDVYEEAMKVATSDDTLRVLSVVKAFGSPNNRVVDNASFGVSQNTVLALLGPNGAGKTTTFNMIRGDVIPDSGDVLINGISVVKNPRTARLSLGVCPQFTAIDSELTVREHLIVYGRLKGLKPGTELERNVEALLHGTSLYMYADRLAARLSGGNQRKLALAIALMGNPAVILIDEFSSGVDAKMKRDMWDTLRSVAGKKAIVITTHSMEEASALATKVGILAKKMLAVGTTEALAERYATYEVHFSCRTREEIVCARQLMSAIPGARMADDVATRFEVPIGDDMTLAGLFGMLSSQRELTEFTVEKAGLESVFLKVIRENSVQEEDSRTSGRRWWRMC